MSCKINIIEKKAKAEYTGLHAYSNRLLKPAYYEVHCWKQQQKAEANQKVKYPLRLPKFCNFIGGFCNFTVPVKNLWLRIPHAFFRDIKSTHTCFQPWIFAQKIKKKIQNCLRNSKLEQFIRRGRRISTVTFTHKISSIINPHYNFIIINISFL